MGVTEQAGQVSVGINRTLPFGLTATDDFLERSFLQFLRLLNHIRRDGEGAASRANQQGLRHG